MAIPDVVSADSRIVPGLESPNTSAAAGAAVSRLLEHPALWRAGQLHRPPAARASGFAELDAHLPGGGWPETGLAEFLLGTTGIGELRVLAPLIRTLSQEQARWIAWINPPFTPYAPALEALGIDLGRMLIINPRTHQEALWALEQTSRSGSCSLALAWLDERQLRPQDTRRLQFAAQQGRMLTCLFRPGHATASHSMAELRLQLAPAESGSLLIDIRKRRGGWPVTGIRLQIDESAGPLAVEEQLSIWRLERQQLVPAQRFDQAQRFAQEVTPTGDRQDRPGTAGDRSVTHGTDTLEPLFEAMPPVTH